MSLSNDGDTLTGDQRAIRPGVRAGVTRGAPVSGRLALSLIAGKVLGRSKSH